MNKLKLYVWEGALKDYTSGVMFALAENEEQARFLIGGSEPVKTIENDLKRYPRVIDSPQGFVVWGRKLDEK